MTIFKTIAAGLLVGLAISLMPIFLLKFFAIILLFKAASRLLGFGGRRHCGHHRFHNMTEAERTAFMEKFGQRCNHYQTKEA